jgi:hypothetical protein
MIAIISAIGFGSIVAAVVGWYGVISNHRQAWINALRDDLAMFLRELEVMHYAIGDLFAAKTVDELPPLEKQKQDARVAVLFIQRRIVLRLKSTRTAAHRTCREAGRTYEN